MAPVVELAEKLKAPVLTTFKAKGQIADDHPLAAGVLGRSGTPIASSLHERGRSADRVRRVLLQPHRDHLARSPSFKSTSIAMALGKFHSVDVPVSGEIGLTADWLRRALPETPGSR